MQFSFGAPAGASPSATTSGALGGFGAAKPSTNTGFGAPAPSSGGSLFGATAATQNTGLGAATAQPGSGSLFGVTATANAPAAAGGFGGAGGGFFSGKSSSGSAGAGSSMGLQQQQQQQQQQRGQQQGQQMSLQHTMLTPYEQLPAPIREEIGAIYSQLKEPTEQQLDEIARARPTVLKDIKNSLGETRLAVIKLRTKQERLIDESKTFREEARQNAADARRFGFGGLQQV
jgi:hypothetical protein